ncbi:MAG TPA: NAD-dependent protein deacetylase [Gemmatimonadaceae bacterium]|nr:NAD-dependent protein deacetylase [Gemmatimonadaceae bacterium]
MASASELLDLDSLTDLLRGRRVTVLVGAGCSTESGIPDYRGPETSQRKRTPIQYREFVGSEAARLRYWARSTVGWRRISAARPNAAHVALAELEAAGIVAGIITQNVDGLHSAAGSRNVVELHGSLASVVCLGCGERTARNDFQRQLLALNGDWAVRLAPGELETAPDGDVELPTSALEHFRVPSCNACETGILKPDVVFFGENVPRQRLEEAWRVFEAGDVLLVAGSSLTVYSGRRFVYRATEMAMPVAIVNIGPTRADDVAAVKVEARLGTVLPALSALLTTHSGR